MASSSLNVLSGIAAAAAGFAGEKVSKNGSVPGLDLAAIVPALIGKNGNSLGIAGTLASMAAKSGLLNSSNIGSLVEMAGSVLSFSNKTGTAKKGTTDSIAGLAATIAGNSGSVASLGSIATLASKLAKPAKNEKELTGIASQLGKSLSSSCGLSFNGPAGALNGLNKVMGNDTKGELFKAVLKGLG